MNMFKRVLSAMGLHYNHKLSREELWRNRLAFTYAVSSCVMLASILYATLNEGLTETQDESPQPPDPELLQDSVGEDEGLGNRKYV